MLTLLRINRSFMEFMRKLYGHMPMAGFEPKYAKYGKAGRVHEPSCSFIRSPPVVVNAITGCGTSSQNSGCVHVE